MKRRFKLALRFTPYFQYCLYGLKNWSNAVGTELTLIPSRLSMQSMFVEKELKIPGCATQMPGDKSPYLPVLLVMSYRGGTSF